MARDEDAAKPTSALSAMINQRSSNQLASSSGSSHTAPIYRPSDLSESDADPTRRRNLVVPGTSSNASSMPPPTAASYKRPSPYGGYGMGSGSSSGYGGAKVLAPPSSSSPYRPSGTEEGGFMKAGDEEAYAANRRAFAGTNGSNSSNGAPASRIPGLGALGGGTLFQNVVAADRDRDRSRSPYFSAPLSRDPSNQSNGRSRPSSEEDDAGRRRGDDSPRPRKRLVRGGDIDRDGVGGSSLAGSEATSPIDDIDGDGSADDVLPDTIKPTPPAAESSEELPPSSMNSRLGKLKMAESRNSSRGASPLTGSPMVIDDDDGAQAGGLAETQAVGAPKAKGKARVLDDDEEDDVEMAPPPSAPAGGAITDASSPPVVSKPIRKRGPVIPDSPDVSFSKNTPSKPSPSGAAFLASITEITDSSRPAIPTPSKAPAPPVRFPSPPKTPGGSVDKERHFQRIAALYKDRDPRELRRLWNSCDGDVVRFTTLLHGPKAGSSQPRKPAQLVSGSLSQGGGSVVSRASTSAAQEAPAPKRKLQKAVEVYSDDEYGSSDEDDEPVVTEEEALKFFNECDEADMPGITSCTLEQAKMVISLRPFEDAEDFKKKLRKKKGVSSAIFEQYRDITKGFIEVDRVLTKCEKHGADLSRIMRIWSGASTSAPSVTASGDPSSSAPAQDGSVHLTELSQNAVDERIKDGAEEVKKAFKGFVKTQPEAIPDNIKLKPYQMLGVNWLNLLHSKGISCILADEMGLGKTAQVIAFLAHLKAKGAEGPHLVMVPSSTLDNWIREFSVFAPSLIVESYYGTQAERAELRYELKKAEELDVVVTTYTVGTSSVEDRKFLEKMDFKSATFDEGHMLKNSESKKYKDLMRVQVPWRLLLTGTPLQNNLQELVSLLSFILPDIFRAARDDLRAIFKVPSDARANLLHQQRITRAKKMMTPFVLRRKKAQVLQDLPKKIEQIEYCGMSSIQRKVYLDTVKRSSKALEDPNVALEIEEKFFDEEAEKPKKGKKPTVPIAKENSTANILMQLRKASNHPMLFRRLYDDKKIRAMAKDCLRELEFHDRNVDYIYEDMEIMTDFELHLFAKQYKALNKYALKKNEWMNAGKIQVLKKLLPELKAKGDRVLLFSQFTQILAILETVLQTMGIRYLLLTGQTPVNERQDMVDEFSNDPDITVFLLSTRAGGLGLNLMAANVVLIHDQDYNPHNDKQAEDRAYRLGQTRDVTVIKLVTKGTIEEDILRLAQNKMALDAQVSSTADPQVVADENGVAIPLGEGDEAQTEKAMKLSLLESFKRRAQEQVDEPEDDGGAAEVEGDGVEEAKATNGDAQPEAT